MTLAGDSGKRGESSQEQPGGVAIGNPDYPRVVVNIVITWLHFFLKTVSLKYTQKSLLSLPHLQTDLKLPIHFKPIRI